MSIDLDSMSLKELKDLSSRVSKAIANFDDRARKAALAEVEALLRAKGLTLAEVTGSSPARRKRSPSVAKFANPANKSDTWSGRGRKPRWYSEALAQGRSPADLAI